MNSKVGFWRRQLGSNFLFLTRALPLARPARSGDKNLRRFLAKLPTFEFIWVYCRRHETLILGSSETKTNRSEALRARKSFPEGKGDEEDRLVEVVASQKSKFHADGSIYWIFALFVIAQAGNLYSDFRDSLAIDYRSKKNLDKYWLPCDHPLKERVDLLFSKPGTTENVQSLLDAGFEILHATPCHPAIIRHPLAEGYVFKVYLDSEKHMREGLSSSEWLLRRCEIADKIRHIIQKKKILYFVVPEKWLYVLPFAQNHPFLLIATDMELEDPLTIKTAWKTQITPRHLDELYFILSKGYGSIDLTFNIPYTKKGLFAFVDTEQPKRFLDLNRVKKHISSDMRTYWQKLMDQ